MTYVFEGLDPAQFSLLSGLTDAAIEARGMLRYNADSVPGFPCRVTLEDAPLGARVLLLNHVSRPEPTPYRASHAIFVREDAEIAARYAGELPPALRTRWLSLRGFDAEGMIVDASLAAPGQADAGLRCLFEDPTIVEVDAHNAVRGCFAARARRA